MDQNDDQWNLGQVISPFPYIDTTKEQFKAFDPIIEENILEILKEINFSKKVYWNFSKKVYWNFSKKLYWNWLISASADFK